MAARFSKPRGVDNKLAKGVVSLGPDGAGTHRKIEKKWPMSYQIIVCMCLCVSMFIYQLT